MCYEKHARTQVSADNRPISLSLVLPLPSLSTTTHAGPAGVMYAGMVYVCGGARKERCPRRETETETSRLSVRFSGPVVFSSLQQRIRRNMNIFTGRGAVVRQLLHTSPFVCGRVPSSPRGCSPGGFVLPVLSRIISVATGFSRFPPSGTQWRPVAPSGTQLHSAG
ncbi:hypothetical protein, no similarity [Maudiozyma saulgeensis]|uniref:Uncharacterized protein n=1 Tax=Maudiozyma saulgeensis TaxID=1789683 RepID=A0A1X7R7Z5_9SACH|nr:hypothetical protein, no similarity [Kazachstania saulgeensis]